MLPSPLVQLAMNPWWPAGIVAVVAAIACGLLWTRRQAETAKAVDLYRFLFENALEGIYENPIGGGFRTVNPAMVRILGYESAEALLKITPEQVEQIYVEPGRRADFLGLVSRSDIVTGFESEIRRPDGSTRWISENVRVVRDAAGRVAAIQGFVTDITDRRLAEAALRESEERYRGLYLANPYPMWIYDRETMRIISVNDAAIAVYGYTRAEFEQMTLSDLRPEREWEHMRSAVRSMQAGPNQMGVFTHRCKDGRELQVEVTTLVFTFHGREQVLSIGNDLTEREQTRAALHDSEFRYQLLFENSPLALVEFNYRSTVEWMDGLRASGVPDLATWADVGSLSAYVYRSAHVEIMRRRREWFERMSSVHLVLWWVPAGHRPTVGEAVARLERLRDAGPGPAAFTFAQAYGPPGSTADAKPFRVDDSCPA